MNVVGIGVHPRNNIAEEQAVAYAKKRAVFLLAEKWKLPNVTERVAALPTAVFDAAVRGVNVLRLARDGEVLYVNTEVSIQDVPLKRALNLPIDEEAAEEIEVTRRGVLVIPVFLEEGAQSPVVWGRRNPVIAPLKPLLLRYGQGALVLASGDRTDRSELDYDNVLRMNFQSLRRFTERYGVQEILQAIVTPGAQGTAEPTRIVMHRMQPTQSRPEMVRIATTAEATMAERMYDAAESIARYAATISTATAEFERKQWRKLPQHKVRLHFTTMQGFGRLEYALSHAPGVENVALDDIALQQVNGVFYTNATPEVLKAYFEESSVRWQYRNGLWVLSQR
jgi:hypothetical protein